MARVYMYSFYSDFIPQYHGTITTKIYMQQKLRDMLVLDQFIKLQVPTFPITETEFTTNQHKYDTVSKQFPLLNMIFMFSSSGKVVVLCNGTYKLFNNKEEAYRHSYGIRDNTPIIEHLVN